jgi:Asp-tRNA(Asn)/Glu-tRNA(Gln) amidotransferase A subunit family amidase
MPIRSIVETSRQLAHGALDPIAVMDACAARINESEPRISAWQFLDLDYARQQAQTRSREPRQSALHGVPVGIKDIFDTADMPTTYGSPIYEGFRPAQDAIVVRRLRAAGCVFPGKAATTEFAHSFPCRTRNPHSFDHTPGGSSSGSAAAVAAGFVLAAIGTQTSGSVIRPASYCGVVGFKPTFGRIPTTGAKALARSLDTVGVFARSVVDAGVVARILWTDDANGKDDREPLPHRPRRVGCCRTEYWEERDPGVEGALAGAVDTLRAAGVRIDEFEMPTTCRGLNALQEQVYAYEANVEFSPLASDRPDDISPDLRELIAFGRTISTAQYELALRNAVLAREAYAHAMQGYDFLLTPSATGEAPRGLRRTGKPVFNRLWTFLHVPCVSLPVATGPCGLPIGIQLVGSAHKDEELLAFGAWVSKQLLN